MTARVRSALRLWRDRRARVPAVPAEWGVAAAALSVGLGIWWPTLVPAEPRASVAATEVWPGGVSLARLDERPLFTPARRSPRAPALIESGERPVEPSARGLDRTHAIKGVARTETDVIVLVENRETRETAVLRLGGLVEGYAVTGIDAHGVTLKAPSGGSVTLRRSNP